MEPIKIAVVGTGRGRVFMRPNLEVTGLKLTAICDRNPGKLEVLKRRLSPDGSLETYTNYDEMLEKADIDAVVLANYFHEHAPFAIKALKAGKHVLSECSAIRTLAEGVELARTVEETGKIYMIAENYPFTKNRLEMKRLYESGELGELLYGEGEYCHAMVTSEVNKIGPGEFHWRNQIPSTYYCTHAIAPIMYITDTMPVRVNGFTANPKDRSYLGPKFAMGDACGIIVSQMSNGAVVRSMQSGFRATSNITTLHCTQGMCEIDRNTGNLTVVHSDSNKNGQPWFRTYAPDWPEHGHLAAQAGHGGGDFWVLYHFGQAIQKNEQPWLNVYRACAMSAIGILAWKSIVNGGKSYDVPDFANEEDRKKYENDNWCPLLEEGEDPTGKPPRNISGFYPNEEIFAVAKAAWEETKYYGLGWTKAEIEAAEKYREEFEAAAK